MAGYASRRRAASGRHALRSAALAADLVLSSGVACDDLVVDAGAGAGLVTAELARWARHVRAVELEPSLAARLRQRFDAVPNVTVVEGDLLDDPLPREPFRVVANLPFAHAAALLARLLGDPGALLSRADVIVDAAAARKRVRERPSTLRSILWAPWYELRLGRALPPEAFRPPPSVAAAVLVVRRRAEPLLAADERAAFERLVSQAFACRRGTVRAGVEPTLSGLELKRAGAAIGFGRDARPRDLTAEQWIELYRLTQRAREEQGRGASRDRGGRARATPREASSRPARRRGHAGG